LDETSKPGAVGWYLDPQNSSLFRWWDGEKWADSTRPVNAPSSTFVTTEIPDQTSILDLTSTTQKFLITHPVKSSAIVFGVVTFLGTCFLWSVFEGSSAKGLFWVLMGFAAFVGLCVIAGVAVWRKNHQFDYPDIVPSGKARAKSDSLAKRRQAIAGAQKDDGKPRCRKCGSSSLRTIRVDSRAKERASVQKVNVVCARCGHKRKMTVAPNWAGFAS